MNKLFKNAMVWIVIAVVLLTVFQSFTPNSIRQQTLDYTSFIELVKTGNVSEVVYIGAADALSLYGLKGELEASMGTAARFRCEVTSMYSTRRQELLMLYHAEQGHYPPLNQTGETRNLGRLSP